MEVQSIRRRSYLAGLAVYAMLALLAWSGGVPAAEVVSPLTGTWNLEAADDIDRQGHHVPAFGMHPNGILIIDAQGRYSLQIFRSNSPTTVGGHEVFKAAQLVSSHFGQVRIDTKRHTLAFVIQMAYSPNWNVSGDYSPNWNSTEQIRSYTLSGDSLSYQIPSDTVGSGGTTPFSAWRRIRQPN